MNNSINNHSGGLLFEDEESIPFATLEQSQRNITKEREFYPIYTHFLAILANLLIVCFQFQFFFKISRNNNHLFIFLNRLFFLDHYLYNLMRKESDTILLF